MYFVWEYCMKCISLRGQRSKLPSSWQKVLSTDFGLPSCCLSCWPNKPGIPFGGAPQLHTEWCMCLVRSSVLSYHCTLEKYKAFLMRLKKAPAPGCPGQGCRLQEQRSAQEGWLSKERHGWSLTQGTCAGDPLILSLPKDEGTDRSLGSTCRRQPPHWHWKLVQHPAEALEAGSTPAEAPALPSPSCSARRPHPRPLRPPEQRAGRAGGTGRFSKRGIWRRTRRRCRNGEGAAVPVRSIAPASPPVLEALPRPAELPEGSPRAARSGRSPSRSPAAPREPGRERLLPAVGLPEQRHSIWFTCCTTAYKD